MNDGIIDISSGELVKDKIQVYLTDISEETVKSIFNNTNNKYVFRHNNFSI